MLHHTPFGAKQNMPRCLMDWLLNTALCHSVELKSQLTPLKTLAHGLNPFHGTERQNAGNLQVAVPKLNKQQQQQKQEEQMLRQLTINCSITKVKFDMSLKYTPDTKSILYLFFSMCVATNYQAWELYAHRRI